MSTKVLELNVDFKESNKSGNTGTFSLQPLERGYGTTLGNALRRVLLTSCLLYTSPSPRDATLSRMPSSA